MGLVDIIGGAQVVLVGSLYETEQDSVCDDWVGLGARDGAQSGAGGAESFATAPAKASAAGVADNAFAAIDNVPLLASCMPGKGVVLCRGEGAGEGRKEGREGSDAESSGRLGRKGGYTAGAKSLG